MLTVVGEGLERVIVEELVCGRRAAGIMFVFLVGATDGGRGWGLLLLL